MALKDARRILRWRLSSYTVGRLLPQFWHNAGEAVEAYFFLSKAQSAGTSEAMKKGDDFAVCRDRLENLTTQVPQNIHHLVGVGNDGQTFNCRELLKRAGEAVASSLQLCRSDELHLQRLKECA